MKMHTTSLTVRFNEVDSYNVAWHGHYIAWMEVGRNDLAMQFGLDAQQLTEEGYLGPVVGLEVKYLHPACFKDQITVCTNLRPCDAAVLVFYNEIRSSDGRTLATGRTTHALTDLQGVLQLRTPPVIAERVLRMTEWLDRL